ncbi:MAG: hypothetical protein U0167_17410 [bacterium]
MKRILAGIALAAILVVPALADMVSVQVTGEVEYNQVRTGRLANVVAGDAVHINFTLDSNDFLDSVNFPTRGYRIQQATFSMTLGSVNLLLQNPFPTGEWPYFVLRNNDPAVDGFYLSTDVDGPTGLPTDEPGHFGNIVAQYAVGYDGAILSSLDILGALGTYDYNGLTNFYMVLTDGPSEPVGLIFTQMTISGAPVAVEPTTWGGIKALYR